MSTEQENFDDILRSKLSEDKVEFNEANWDKAEALIIQADKKRKRRRIGFIFFIGLVLGVCLMIPFIGSKKESLTNRDKKVNTKKNDVSIENNTKTENKESEKETVVSQKSNIPTNHNTKDNKQAEDVSQTNENAVKVYSETKPKEDKVVSANSSKKNTPNNVVIPSVKKEQKTVSTKPSNNNTTNDTFVSNSPKSKAPNKEKQKSRSEGVNSYNTLPNTRENETVLNKGVKNTASKQEQVITKSENPKDVSKTIDTTINVSAITNKSIVKDTTIAVKDSIAKTKPDTVKPVAKETSQETKNESLKQTTIFSIDAGANYTLGWKYNTTKEATGFNAVLGASVMHYFTVKWSVLVGLQYNSLAHLSYSSYSGSNTQLGFGYTTSYTTITPKMLYYMAIPVKLQYHLNKNNSISAGVNVLHLLNASSTVSTYTQTDFTTSNHATTSKMGYMDGLSTWDIQPAVAYRRRIHKGFSICAEAYYGLIDIKSNSFFGINKSERNSGFKLVLSYSFIK
jgi:hypothetical protein